LDNILLVVFSYDYSYGEIVPLGSNYLASYAAGVRTGILELGPKLIGQDPTQASTFRSIEHQNIDFLTAEAVLVIAFTTPPHPPPSPIPYKTFLNLLLSF
jgi:hypothetical protein